MATKKSRVGNMSVHANKVSVEGPSAPTKYVPPIKRKSGWDDYDLDSFLRTLQEAVQIKKNRPLMRALRAKAREKLQATQQLTKHLED